MDTDEDLTEKRTINRSFDDGTSLTMDGKSCDNMEDSPSSERDEEDLNHDQSTADVINESEFDWNNNMIDLYNNEIEIIDNSINENPFGFMLTIDFIIFLTSFFKL